MSGKHMTAREFVGIEIRCAREAQDPRMSRAKLASMLYVSESLVAKWERGKLTPVEYFDKLREILGLPEMIVRIVERLSGNDLSPEWFGRWPVFENMATSLLSFQPCVLPGLLQTPAYARAVLEPSEQDIDLQEAVRTRLDRQKVLTKEDPPMYVVLLSESVLYHMAGSDETMYEQMMYLAEMAQRSNVFVHIIPNKAIASAGFISGFDIAGFDGEEVALVDNQLDGDTIESPTDVARLRRLSDRFRADALDRKQSLDLIRKAAEQWQ
jgi:hypothetical protein